MKKAVHRENVLGDIKYLCLCAMVDGVTGIKNIFEFVRRSDGRPISRRYIATELSRSIAEGLVLRSYRDKYSLTDRGQLAVDTTTAYHRKMAGALEVSLETRYGGFCGDEEI